MNQNKVWWIGGGAIVAVGALCAICAICGLVVVLLSGERSEPEIVRLLSPIDAGVPPLTGQAVIDKFNAAGLGVTDVRPEKREPDSPLPNSFQEYLGFAIPEVAPKGGQVFVCDTKRNCDAIYAYFDALKSMAGPYLYQSPGGTVVVQLNSGLNPETGAKFEAVVRSLP